MQPACLSFCAHVAYLCLTFGVCYVPGTCSSFALLCSMMGLGTDTKRLMLNEYWRATYHYVWLHAKTQTPTSMPPNRVH